MQALTMMQGSFPFFPQLIHGQWYHQKLWMKKKKQNKINAFLLDI